MMAIYVCECGHTERIGSDDKIIYARCRKCERIARQSSRWKNSFRDVLSSDFSCGDLVLECKPMQYGLEQIRSKSLSKKDIMKEYNIKKPVAPILREICKLLQFEIIE